jgi:hypothetical protein
VAQEADDPAATGDLARDPKNRWEIAAAVDGDEEDVGHGLLPRGRVDHIENGSNEVAHPCLCRQAIKTAVSAQ